MRFVLANLALWAIAIVIAAVMAPAATVLGPLLAVCAIGSTMVVRWAAAVRR
jgi:hypothetical protein